MARRLAGGTSDALSSSVPSMSSAIRRTLISFRSSDLPILQFLSGRCLLPPAKCSQHILLLSSGETADAPIACGIWVLNQEPAFPFISWARHGSDSAKLNCGCAIGSADHAQASSGSLRRTLDTLIGRAYLRRK